MAKTFKVLLLLLLITAMVWLSTLWRWQTMQADPSGQDLAVYLVLLPLALTLVFLLAFWSVKKIRKTIESPLQPPAAKAVRTPLKPSEKPSTD